MAGLPIIPVKTPEPGPKSIPALANIFHMDKGLWCRPKHFKRALASRIANSGETDHNSLMSVV